MRQLTTARGAPIRPYSFGTMQFGGRANETDSAQMFEAALDAGITHFDTAWVYNEGRSEEILGRLIKGHDDLYIATKYGSKGGSGRANMTAQFDDSRKRLDRDSVDLFYLHNFDPTTEMRDVVEGLAELQSKKLIRHIGISNHAAWQVMKLQAIAAEFDTRIDVMQPMYNLVKRQAEVEILPMCDTEDIAACTYSPLGGGLLTGKYSAGQKGRLDEDAMYATRYGHTAMQEAATNLSKLATELGHSATTLAVAWAAACPLGVQPILSARTAEQLAPSLAAMTFDMTPALYAQISDLMPAPPPATDRSEEA